MIATIRSRHTTTDGRHAMAGFRVLYLAAAIGASCSGAVSLATWAAGAEPQQQGTQIDALGHVASIKAPWDPKDAYSADGASYYGGFRQQDVKPSADSPLLKLGMEKMPPLVTTAVLLDAKEVVGQ